MPATASLDQPLLPLEVARRALAEARTALGMDVAWLGEIVSERLVLHAVDGDGSQLGVVEGAAVPLSETVCARMLDGELECWLPDLAGHDPIRAYVGVPVRHADGALYGTLACAAALPVLDLGARDERMLRALAGVVAGQLEHERHYHQVLETAADPVWVTDLSGHTVFANEPLARLLGAERRELKGISALAFVDPGQLDRARQGLASRAEGVMERYEIDLVRTDGRPVPVEVHGAPLTDRAGKVIGTVATLADLSERKAAERLSEERFRWLAELVAHHVWITDADGAVVYANDRLRTYLGEGVAHAHVHDWLKAFHPQDLAQAGAAADPARLIGRPYVFEARLRRHDGEYREHRCQAWPGLDEDGRPERWYGVSTDLTDERAQERLLRSEAAGRAKSEFLSRTSHELRTPLNAILGFGQLLELEALTTDQRDSVGHILKGGAHLLELINEVLEISRIEAGALRLSLEPVELVEAVRDVVDLVAPLAHERSVTIGIDAGAGGTGWVRADLQRVKQIVLNLLSNAIKYNRTGGSVAVQVRPAGDDPTRLVVTDTGAGLREEEIERAFSPFERLAADDATEGTGLGLTLSRSLAEAMGGRLTARSEPGGGAAFTLLLEPAPAPEGEPGAPAGAPLAIPAERIEAGRRVLCIEDNPSNLRLVERVLQRAGIEVLGAPQGRLGIELARRHVPDLILLDLDLPDLPGESVLAALAADPATATVPVVVCSADASTATIDRLRAEGAAAYLTKPLDVALLLKTVAELTDGSPG